MAPGTFVEKYDETKKSLVDKVIALAGKTSTDHWMGHFRKPMKDADTMTPTLDAHIMGLESQIKAMQDRSEKNQTLIQVLEDEKEQFRKLNVKFKLDLEDSLKYGRVQQ